jgi:hypothetical protein
MKRLSLAALLLLGACATDTPAPPPAPRAAAPAPVGAAVGQSVETTSIVETVDMTTREVLLRLENGEFMTLKVPASMRNLGQVKPGSRVVARVTTAVAAQLTKADGTTPVEAGEVAVEAPKGARIPAGAFVRGVRMRVIIDSVNAAGTQATFTTPRGIPRTVSITDPDMIAFAKTLKKGDAVNITALEAISLRVLPPNAATVGAAAAPATR